MKTITFVLAAVTLFVVGCDSSAKKTVADLDAGAAPVAVAAASAAVAPAVDTAAAPAASAPAVSDAAVSADAKK